MCSEIRKKKDALSGVFIPISKKLKNKLRNLACMDYQMTLQWNKMTIFVIN